MSEKLETHTAYLLGCLLGGLNKADNHTKTKSANWKGNGSEAVIEFWGKFYKITVEQIKV